MTKEELKTDESKYIIKLVIKDKLKSEFEKYLKDSADYYDPREPLTERKLLQMWLDCAEPREKRIADLEAQIEEMKCCENCAFFKDKTYDICHRIKKLGTRKCAFYKMI